MSIIVYYRSLHSIYNVVKIMTLVILTSDSSKDRTKLIVIVYTKKQITYDIFIL